MDLSIPQRFNGPLESDGRKRHAGAAVLSAGGEILAVSRALLVEPRSE